MDDDDFSFENMSMLHNLFVGLVGGGFSENQALKLIAMTMSLSEQFEGMPGGDS